MKAAPLNPIGIVSTFKAGAENGDIRQGLEMAIPLATAQMKGHSERFRGKTEYETAKKIHSLLVKRATYKKDGENQDIQFPSKFNHTKKADCKTYTLLTAAILENLKIPYSIVYASYDASPIPKHVYIMTGGGVIIDAVWTQRGGGKFNTEKKATYKYTKPMNVRYLAGFEDSPALGKVDFKKAAQKVKQVAQKATQTVKKDVKQVAKTTGQTVKKVAQTTGKVAKTIVKTEAHIAKKVALAPGRGLLLLAVKNNYNGLANGFAKANQGNVKKYWEIAGGKYSELQNAINSGVRQAPKKSGLLRKIMGILKGNKVNGIGCCFSHNDRATVQGIGVVAETAATVSFVGVVIAMLPIIQQVIALIPAKTAKETSENPDGSPIPDSPTGTNVTVATSSETTGAPGGGSGGAGSYSAPQSGGGVMPQNDGSTPMSVNPIYDMWNGLPPIAKIGVGAAAIWGLSKLLK